MLVDQTQIGRTTRSNPASYVGAFDAIRKRFAREPLARERGYTLGTFSFNSGNGRCPTCGGNGFEHVEMQFLSDVYLRCPDCDGQRFRAEILEVRIRRDDGPPRSIADMLDLTVSEAVEFFADDRDVLARLEPLAAVGLDYLRLGQPVPTLSGGEAQRLKLAGHLADDARPPENADAHRFFAEEIGERPAAARCSCSTSRPPACISTTSRKLLGAFRRLLDAGHSLLVIEHNLDVIRAADWIIDLGPEGGDAGGACSSPARRRRSRRSPRRTPGVRLLEYDAERAAVLAAGRALLPARIEAAGAARRRRRPRRAIRSSCTRRASTTCATSTSRFRATA